MSKTPHKYFDSLIKSTLSNTTKAKEFLKAHLPKRIKNYVDFGKDINLVNREFDSVLKTKFQLL